MKRWLSFSVLHDVISQKIELFITSGVRTSNPTFNSCTNESHSRVVLSKGVDAINKGPHGRRERHPIDTPADGSPPESTLWATT
jgi:hypothetical protein